MNIIPLSLGAVYSLGAIAYVWFVLVKRRKVVNVDELDYATAVVLLIAAAALIYVGTGR